MLKKAVAVTAALIVLATTQNAMAKDVRPSAVTLKPVAAASAETPAPARVRVAKRNDIFGVPGLSGLGLALSGVIVTAGIIVAASSGGSPS
ncbi:hypothetical protein [Novosphingobium sediminicola]|uniref:Uncharacterized protein n=1 Tax=Novosphingobium sediminicola TaxID=563162 RepID=A0A7W6G7X0_9SPHN|nr:hypothetical protein [Novosphingobium sediminicola]MBB3956818.1 hypothetical protein [Novosphingobium sediminicola]